MLFVFSMIDDFFAEPLEPTVNVEERRGRKKKHTRKAQGKEKHEGEGVVQRKTLLPVLREQKLMRSSIRSSGNQSIPAAPPIRFSGLEKRRPHLQHDLTPSPKSL